MARTIPRTDPDKVNPIVWTRAWANKAKDTHRAPSRFHTKKCPFCEGYAALHLSIGWTALLLSY